MRVEMTWPMFTRCECKVGSDVVRLTLTQHRILVMLLLRAPKSVSITEIIRELYRPDTMPVDPTSTVNKHISHLRHRIKNALIGDVTISRLISRPM